MEAESIYVVGDVHAEFPAFNKMIKETSPDIILQCGDFGWWPHKHNLAGFIGKTKLFDQYGIRNGDTKIYWCDGNHENHDDLRLLVDKHGRVPIEVMPNVFYCPRGSTLVINNKTYLFFGGATSIDKCMRIPGDSWWSGENITNDDLDSLPDIRVDVVITHAAPKYFKFNKIIDSDRDFNRNALNFLFDKYKPNFWYFGHYHLYNSGVFRECRWTCLSDIQDKRLFAKKLMPDMINS